MIIDKKILEEALELGGRDPSDHPTNFAGDTEYVAELLGELKVAVELVEAKIHSLRRESFKAFDDAHRARRDRDRADEAELDA